MALPDHGRRRGRATAGLVGGCDPSVESVLRDALGEIDVVLDPDLRGPRPDFVIAVIEEEDFAVVLDAARLLAGRRPILAVSGLDDEVLAVRAIARGAVACYALDTPLARLQLLVGALVGAGRDPS